MPNRFKPGDIVLLARPSATVGRLGIMECQFGLEYTVDQTHGNNSYIIAGHGHIYSVRHDMLDSAGGPW